MRKLMQAGVLAFAVLAASAAHAQDNSVEQRLDAQGMKYEIDDDGDFRLIYNYVKEGRTQLLFVASKTETVDGLTVREIFAPAVNLSNYSLSDETLANLLRESSGLKLGSWEIRGSGLYLVAKVLEPIGGAELEAVMDTIAESADNMEIKLTDGSDDL